MGNLVGCATWEHFWLNEGHTVFLERKILGRLHGDASLPAGGAAGQIYNDFLTMGGISALRDSVDAFVSKGELNYTRLVPTLQGIDPDDSFSRVPYEKGFSLLHYLEQKVGGPAVFEPYLRAYVDNFQRKSITTAEFRRFFEDYFTKAGLTSKLEGLDWEHLLYGEGSCDGYLPVKEMKLDNSLASAALGLAEAWCNNDTGAVAAVDTTTWGSKEWELMLGRLMEVEPLPSKETVLRLIESYRLTESRNSEIRCRYQRLALAVGCGPEEPSTVQTVNFLREQGRMKFVRPLYRQMFKNSATKDLAVQTFEENRSSYHSIAAKMIAEDLELNKTASSCKL